MTETGTVVQDVVDANLTQAQVNAKVQELLALVAKTSATDPMQTKKYLSQLSSLMTKQKDVLQEQANEIKGKHQSEIEKLLGEAYEMVATYAKDENLPAFSVIFRVGFVTLPNEKEVNGTVFDWAKRSEKRTTQTSGRKRNGSLYNEKGELVGEFASATAACKSLNIEIPISEKNGKPSRNAMLLLKDNKYTWKQAVATEEETAAVAAGE